jgi:hypothetical protein
MSDTKEAVIGLTELITIHSADSKKKRRIKARIDTGAQSNSIDSTLAASLNLGPIVNTTMVRSANGNSLRPVVNTKIEIGGRELKGRFTLADRSNMKYKVLIGRNILSKSGFLIDPTKP